LHAVPAMLAARARGVPTATFIYSWDNLPKGRMPVRADFYLVWSDFMKAELLSYYPDVTADRVRIVGTPQFESYADSGLEESRTTFLQRLNLDPKKSVVCFSGDDPGCSPYDPEYLRDLARSLRSVPESIRPQIVFRRSPVDWSGRYDDVLREYPEIAVSDPKWQRVSDGDWSQILPTREDVGLLVNLVRHSDLVVNLGSTMAMDFAAFEKPAIYVAYNPVSNDPHWSVEDVYRRPHFGSVHELQPVYWARSRENLADLVMHALNQPGEKSEARQKWLHRHVLQPMAGASRRAADTLRQLALERPSRSTEPEDRESEMAVGATRR
ncbi:MAG TPA: UDP-glycosyltransferase, partial [Thermoanaerobaculia bacterium]|nr:UDP-glycosyltransferase [Thermoanaerobaculia bacterium]